MFRVHPDPSAATDRSQPTRSRRQEGSRATPGKRENLTSLPTATLGAPAEARALARRGRRARAATGLTASELVEGDGGPITIVVGSRNGVRLVKIAGELDLASQAVVTRRCTEGPHRDVEVNLAALTFLDCGGYRALVAARTALGQHRRTLTVVGAAGEPRRLLELLGAVGPS